MDLEFLKHNKLKMCKGYVPDTDSNLNLLVTHMQGGQAQGLRVPDNGVEVLPSAIHCLQ